MHIAYSRLLCQCHRHIQELTLTEIRLNMRNSTRTDSEELTFEHVVNQALNSKPVLSDASIISDPETEIKNRLSGYQLIRFIEYERVPTPVDIHFTTSINLGELEKSLERYYHEHH